VHPELIQVAQQHQYVSGLHPASISAEEQAARPSITATADVTFLVPAVL
jgi:hypothetical protein